jgi:copper chaperone
MSTEHVITLKVADMTCGHCAQSIVKAIQKGLPAAKVQADPATKLVAVTGVADATAVKDLVANAGFTPTAV